MAAGWSPPMWLAAPYCGGAPGGWGAPAPWVSPSMGAAALRRLTACAAASLAVLQSAAAVGAGDVDPEEAALTTFRAPLDFDALLVLQPDALPQVWRSFVPTRPLQLVHALKVTVRHP